MKITEDQWNRWVDDELSPADCETIGDVDLAQEKKLAQQIGKDLRQTVASQDDLPAPDFFNHQLHKRIDEIQTAAAPARQPSLQERILDWFSPARLLPLAAGIVLTLAIIKIGSLGKEASTRLVHQFSPDSQVVVKSEHIGGDVNAMVVRFEGIGEVPKLTFNHGMNSDREKTAAVNFSQSLPVVLFQAAVSNQAQYY